MGNSSSGSDDNNATATTTRLGEGKYALGGHRAFSPALSSPRRMNSVLKGSPRNAEKVRDVAQPPYREGSRARRRRV